MADDLNDVSTPPFYLVTEPSFHARYLIDQWVDRFRSVSGFRGIAIRASGATSPECTSETEQIMLRLFGAPSGSDIESPTFYLGSDLNAAGARQWLLEVGTHEEPYILIFLDQLLAPWWISVTKSRIINAHSAVLPFARGMHAIEQLAAAGDRCAFVRAAGATVHYIDTGVDSGPIIRAEQFARPFQCDSIWELKARVLMMAYDLLIEIAAGLSSSPLTLPVGLSVDPATLGPNFRCAAFTASVRKRAELGFAQMKGAK